MTFDELTAWLTDGLDDASKTAVIAAVNRDSIKNRAASLKQQKELDAIMAERVRLQSELEGTQDKPGARAYADWYNKNYAAIEANDKAIQAYEAKHGKGSLAAAITTTTTTTTPPTTTYTPEQVEKMIEEKFTKFTPRVASVLKDTGTLVQKHMYAGRKNPIDFDALDKMMGEKNMSIYQAYDEWDKPERERVAKEEEDARVNKRVEEEVQKRMAGAHFPAAADMTPSSLSSRTKEYTDKFDKTRLMSDLAETFKTGEYKQ